VFPQLFLGSACVAALIPAWAPLNPDISVRELVPVAVFIMCWITYIDMFYATMVC